MGRLSSILAAVAAAFSTSRSVVFMLDLPMECCLSHVSPPEPYIAVQAMHLPRTYGDHSFETLGGLGRPTKSTF
jgi:hypothetical protein